MSKIVELLNDLRAGVNESDPFHKTIDDLDQEIGWLEKTLTDENTELRGELHRTESLLRRIRVHISAHFRELSEEAKHKPF